MHLVDALNYHDNYSYIIKLQNQDYTFDLYGTCSLTIQFYELSSAYDNRQFILYAQYGTTIGISTSMRSIKYQLSSDYSSNPSSLLIPSPIKSSISTLESQSQPQSTLSETLTKSKKYISPIVWYKDRGGKKNCIEIPVRLVSSDGENVLGMIIPIHVELIYSDGTVVDNQQILEMNRESRLLTIGSTGQSILRIRITEVSMRHKGKLFALKISPDTLKSSICKDISPVISNSIEVKSKLTPSHSTNQNIVPFHLQQLPSLQFISMINKGNNNINNNTNNNINNTNNNNNNSNNKKRSIEECYNHQNNLNEKVSTIVSQTTTNSAIGESNSSSLNSLLSSISIPTTKITPDFIMNNSEINNNSNDQTETQFNNSTEESLKILQLWSFNVINQLTNLKWVPIGQEISNQPPSTRSQPIYQMTNPNQVIDDIISSYYQIQQNTIQITKLNRDNSPSAESYQSNLESLGSTSDDNEWDFDSLPNLLDSHYPTNSLSLCLNEFNNNEI